MGWAVMRPVICVRACKVGGQARGTPCLPFPPPSAAARTRAPAVVLRHSACTAGTTSALMPCGGRQGGQAGGLAGRECRKAVQGAGQDEGVKRARGQKGMRGSRTCLPRNLVSLPCQPPFGVPPPDTAHQLQGADVRSNCAAESGKEWSTYAHPEPPPAHAPPLPTRPIALSHSPLSMPRTSSAGTSCAATGLGAVAASTSAHCNSISSASPSAPVSSGLRGGAGRGEAAGQV